MRNLHLYKKIAAVAAVLCFGLHAATASATLVWLPFHQTGADPAASASVPQGELSVTVTPSTQRVLIRTLGRGFGVGAVGMRNADTDAVGRGESLFLTFNREVTLRAIGHFDVDGGSSQFLGRDAGHYYEVYRDGSLIATVDPKEPAYTGERGRDAPRADQMPVLVQFAPDQGIRGQQFELRTPALREGEDDTEFFWWLGGVLVDAQSTAPIPEPSTALLTGAGLFALGFAGRRRRRA